MGFHSERAAAGLGPSGLKDISWKSSSVLFFNDCAFVGTIAGQEGGDCDIEIVLTHPHAYPYILALFFYIRGLSLQLFHYYC